jgi:hypothetical protein
MENGNEKRKFVFLGQPTVNGIRRLLFQQRCPSMHARYTGSTQMAARMVKGFFSIHKHINI